MPCEIFGAYIFRLMKANDCDEVKLSYQCDTGSGYIACDPLHTNPPSSLKIRAKCGQQEGPVIAIKDIDAI